MCLFTVFTPTYNRARLLSGVYHSLLAQTLQDFEWLVVDDGSEDGTRALVAGWQAEGRLAVRYVRQDNQGKHVAHNRAVAEARGAFLTVLDSDDRCVPRALERLYHHWQGVPEGERDGYSGVACLCADAAGGIVGDRFPAAVFDAGPLYVSHRLGIAGEKWGMHRTAVLREFPFPVFAGERFVPEGLVWNRVGRRYRLRFVNEALRIYEARADGLSARIGRLRRDNPRGMSLYYRELLGLPVNWRVKAKAAVNYGRTALQARLAAMRARGGT